LIFGSSLGSTHLEHIDYDPIASNIVASGYTYDNNLTGYTLTGSVPFIVMYGGTDMAL